MKEEKLKELVQEMSIKEKVGQMFQIHGGLFAEDAALTGPVQKMGIQEEDIFLAGSAIGVKGAENTKRVQKKYMEKHPHHIPLLFMLDIINGFKTVYPIPLAQGATFDPHLSKECAAMAARESAASGLHVTFSPMTDLVRDPRWGRVMESTGEDVFLNSCFGAAMVEGYQGEDLSCSDSIAACVKHFAGYGAAEAGRDYNTVEVSENTFREYYLPAYQASIDAGAALVMTSFNTINAIPATVNPWLMKTVLREEMGFEGVLITDFSAITETINHGVAADRMDAAKRAVEVGVDIDMMSGAYPEKLQKLVEEGKISEELIDSAVLRVLELKNKLGLFENPYKGADELREAAITLCNDHRELARKAARESFVLLKNEGDILPLDPKKKIAFIGPYTDRIFMLGGWSFSGNPKDTVTIKKAAEEVWGSVNISYCSGCPIIGNDEKLEGFTKHEEPVFSQEEIDQMMEEAIEQAKKADTVVMPVGEHFLQSGEATSRGFLTIPAIQQQLFNRIYEVNQNIVVVLFQGRPLDLRELAEKARAILTVWMPGTEGGHAIMDVLTGAYNPSGKLPMSFPYCTGQIPVHYDEFATGRHHVPGQDQDRYTSKYLDIPNAPLYPFGFGKSYTSFSVSEICLNSNVMQADEQIEATVCVKNTGNYEGTEVLQMYLHDVCASAVRPMKQLKAFKKVSLKPGEERKIVFRIDEKMLKFHTAYGKYASESGEFEVYVGNSSQTDNKASFWLTESGL